MDKKMYRIESENRSVIPGDVFIFYRYCSLYNSSKGGWYFFKSMAIKEGEQHQKFIEKMHSEGAKKPSIPKTERFA